MVSVSARTEDDQYYSIDGLAGTQVAKQIRRGDRIIIGRNGEVPRREQRTRNRPLSASEG